MKSVTYRKNSPFPELLTGYYWKLEGDYPLNGPFATLDAAERAAEEHFEEIKRKVLS